MSNPSNDAITNADLPKIIDNGESNNYAEWKTRSQRKLRGWGLWKYIDGAYSTPPEIPPFRPTTIQKGKGKSGVVEDFEVEGNKDEFDKRTEEAKPWLSGNELALDKIIDATPSEILPMVQDLPYAKQAWEVLHETYQPMNAMRAASVRGDITSYRCTSDMDVSLWLKDMQKQFNILRDMDVAIMSEHDFVIAILNNMPQDDGWRTTIAGLRTKLKNSDEHKPDPLPVNPFDYIADIKEEAWIRSKGNAQANAHAFAARSEAEKRAPKRFRTSPDSSAPGSVKRTRTSNDKVCANTYCTSQKGHAFADCIAYTGGSQGKYTLWWRGPWNIHLPPEQRNRGNNIPPTSHPAYARTTATSSSTKSNTYFMHKPTQAQDPGAHYAQDSSFQLSRANTSGSITTDDDSVVIHAALCHETPGHAWLDTLNNEVLVATMPILENSLPISDACYHDTGANRHVFHDREAFEVYDPIEPVAVKGFGKNIAIAAIGCGTVRVEGHYGTQECTILLKDALHIPAARCNLVSGVQLDKIGITATTGNGLVSLVFRNSNIVGGALEGDMYRLNMTIIRPSRSLSSRVQPQALITRISPMAAAASSDQQGFYTAC
jgi:hypothetical protein